ncbi:DNA helicase II [Candidatus Photodesmus blepharus]|uniref:DNA 3'-5' helicase n=1 Tax=Candidatus Photodesmus blepharonis TaxID=1179155 RepID=A0A084CN62_9GAMM|nr:DNA helicase II [Candidatus Photodesmus blepharus]KEY91241.1 DNA helicase II [Candidatus Photodesmus blepharus]
MIDENLLFNALNNRQREAVMAPLKNLLVLAGAGSGKTRVLVYRIAWLISVEQVSPFSIMSVTFTNKAAIEIRNRVEKLMMGSDSGMWSGTFHGICHRLLRAHCLEANLSEDFQVIDTDDQIRLLRRLIKIQNLDEKKISAEQSAYWINCKKDEGLRPQHIDAYYNPMIRIHLQIYKIYQEACDRANLVDFAEILLRAHELLRNRKDIREHYQSLFKYILVDEFQDTNNIQYAWLRMISGLKCHVMVVGDDDQSIYGWRGAKVENIEKFIFDFPNASTICLEQNYRSTKIILEAANTLISNNVGRMNKELWTNSEKGERISIYSAYNELDEANFIIRKIKEWNKVRSSLLNDIAVLYRNNSQSRVLEEALVRAGIPYRIYGGTRFFERKEIKDVLSYLRLILNRNDDAAFERIVNIPMRGLGNKTLEVIRFAAQDRNATMWQTSIALLDEKILSKRAAECLSCFIELINTMEKDTIGMPLHERTDYVIKHSGLFAMYEKERSEKSQVRIDNLEELVTATRQFKKPKEVEGMESMTAFLTHSAFESSGNQVVGSKEVVQLMTLHSAKGLEFSLVFMVGVEEGIFPSPMSAKKESSLEEERRLCYVGMTRAMEKLYMTYATTRRLYGQDKYRNRSRFIHELPQICLEEVSIQIQANNFSICNQNFVQERSNEIGFCLGTQVIHPNFGQGTIINSEGHGQRSRVQVDFNSEGVKWLVTAYAKLKRAR